MDEDGEATSATKASSLRWAILRRALLRRSSPDTGEQKSEIAIKHVSRKTNRGFNLIPCKLMDDHQLEGNSPNRSSSVSSEACFCYTLPILNFSKLFLFQRVGNDAVLNDFEICNRYDIDNTGIVCQLRLTDKRVDALVAKFLVLSSQIWKRLSQSSSLSTM